MTLPAATMAMSSSCALRRRVQGRGVRRGAVGDGPVATVRPDRACVPVLLHAAWMPSVGPALDDDRLRFADDVPDSAVDALDPDLAALVQRVSADLDRDLLD